MSLFLSFSQLFPAIFKMTENDFMQSAIKVFLGFFDMSHTHLPKLQIHCSCLMGDKISAKVCF